MVQDLRYALRVLRRTPGFTAVALATVALGVGANTAMFSLADAALLRSPPVAEPDQLVAVYTTCRRGEQRCSSSYPDYLDYRDRATTLADLAAYTWLTANLGDAGGARLVTVQMATGNYFNVLGVQRGLGRLLVPDDDRRGEARPVAVLSHELWRDQFGGDSAIVGSTVRLNRAAFEVVGVAPRGFDGLDLGEGPDVYIPLLAGPTLAVGFVEDDSRFYDRASRWISQLVGRIAPGGTIEQARAELLAISDQMALEHPDARGPRTITVDAMPGHILPVSARDDLRRFVALLLGVVAFSLLLACANLANLLLTRAAARRREIGVRLSLGAGRIRLVRQLLTESVTLAVIGGIAGVVVAVWTLQLLAGFDLPGGVMIGDLGVRLDARMLGIASALSLATGMLFGVVPALQATRPNLVSALKAGAGAAGPARHRMRGGLVAVQVALCLILLVGSGLFIRTLGKSLAFNAGFDTDRLALARFDLGLTRYGVEEGEQLVSRLLDRVRALPTVETAAVASLVPFQAGGHLGTFVTVEGYEPGPDEEMRVEYVFVGPDFFRSLGIPFRAGRSITAADDGRAPRVIVINETMVRRWWPDGNAVGGVIAVGGTTFRVVGVVGDATWRQLGETPIPVVFLPFAQAADRIVDSPLTLAVRATGAPETLFPVIRSEVGLLDRELSFMTLTTMRAEVGRVLMPQRMGSVLLTLFAALGLILASVGIYGVVSYAVAQDTRQIGIRMALGAKQSDVLGQVLAGMATPIGIGLGVGVLVALLLAGFLEQFLFGVHPRDPVTFVVLGSMLSAVALVATLLPARRATRIEPMEALRYE